MYQRILATLDCKADIKREGIGQAIDNCDQLRPGVYYSQYRRVIQRYMDRNFNFLF